MHRPTIKDTKTVLDACKEVNLEIQCRENQVHVHVLSLECKKNINIKTVKKYYDNVAKFKFLGMTAKNQTYNHKYIKSRLNLGNACYHLVQNLSPPHLLSTNRKIKIYETNIICCFSL
jgi:hypothetical protein